MNRRNSDLEDLVTPEVEGQPGSISRLARCRSWLFRHKFLLSVLFIACLIVSGHLVCYYYIYGKRPPHLKVFSMNTWGMPESLGSKFKTERMHAIGKEITKFEYDLYLLQELWMQPDHELIADYVNKANGNGTTYYMTQFRELALSTCDGRVAPTFCSGLAIVSRFPFDQIYFESYTERGYPFASDGEWFARKGVGRVRIRPLHNSSLTMDVFVTHTAADPDPRTHNYSNAYYRNAQVRELMHTYVSQSTADLVLLAGDFNDQPDFKSEALYQVIRNEMSSAVEDMYYYIQRWWFDLNLATYAHTSNTFSGGVYSPTIYDYIFYKSNHPTVKMSTNWYHLPLLKFDLSLIRQALHFLQPSDAASTQPPQPEKLVADQGLEGSVMVSFSDHEAITANIYLHKKE